MIPLPKYLDPGVKGLLLQRTKDEPTVKVPSYWVKYPRYLPELYLSAPYRCVLP